MKFVFPLPPVNLGNHRLHHFAKHRKMKEYFRALDDLRLLCDPRTINGPTDMVWKVPQPPDDPFKRATISYHLFVHNVHDEDGACARVKWPQDWLVSRDYIVDDSTKVLRWAGMVEQTIDRRSPRIEMELLEVEETL